MAKRSPMDWLLGKDPDDGSFAHERRNRRRATSDDETPTVHRGQIDPDRQPAASRPVTYYWLKPATEGGVSYKVKLIGFLSGGAIRVANSAGEEFNIMPDDIWTEAGYGDAWEWNPNQR